MRAGQLMAKLICQGALIVR